MNYNHEQYIDKAHFSLQHTTLEDIVSPAILYKKQYDSRSASHLDYTKRAQLAVVSCKVCSAPFNRMRRVPSRATR